MSTVAVRTGDTTRLRWWMVWAGRVVSIAPVAIVLISARWKLTADPAYVREFIRIGWPVSVMPALAFLQLTAVVLFVIPPTAVLGAVLLTGYLGGAIASYVRIGELYPPLVPLTTALLAWLGVYLREQRLWLLLPLRRRPRHGA
jgi:hypothetical protein